MEIEDGNGNTTKPVNEKLLPNVFQAKVDHPSFETWKALSESKKEDWDNVQVLFLRQAEKTCMTNHDSTGKFRTANQNMLGRGQLSNKEKEKYEEAIKEGKGLIWNIYRKLSKEQRQKLKEARQKKRNDGGLGLQYNLQQQLSSLPKGTILVPMQAQTNKTTSGQEEEQEE